MRLLPALLLLSLSLPAMAGKLDDFEQSATTSQSEKQSSKKHSSSSGKSSQSSSRSSETSGFAGAMVEAILFPIVEVVVKTTVYAAAHATDQVLTTGTQGSLKQSERTLQEPIDIPDLSEDADGHYGVPLLLADISYGSGDDIEWRDLRLETGYGPISLFYRRSKYLEPDIDDEMLVSNFSVNYRLYYGARVEFDAGLGKYWLQGNDDTSSASFRLALKLRMFDNVWLTASRIATMGDELDLSDSEYALVYGKRHWFVRSYYRRLNAENSSLDGFGFGVGLLY